MRKSSFGMGRPSISTGAPLRVRPDNNSSQARGAKARSRSNSQEKKTRSLSFGTSSGGFGGASTSHQGNSRISFVPKTGWVAVVGTELQRHKLSYWISCLLISGQHFFLSCSPRPCWGGSNHSVASPFGHSGWFSQSQDHLFCGYSRESDLNRSAD